MVVLWNSIYHVVLSKHQIVMLDVLECAVNISNSTSSSISLLNNVIELMIMLSDDSRKLFIGQCLRSR